MSRLRPLVPWASLALGVLGAALMDRSPERAWLAIVAIALGWAGVVTLTVLERRPAGQSWVWRTARFSSRVAALGPVQFALFFTLPFYVRAWAGTVGQAAFLVLLAVAAALTLWDPLHVQLLARPWGAAALHGVATLAALAAWLPIFGVSHATSLGIATAASAVVMPALGAVAAAPRPDRRTVAVLLGMSLLLVLVLLVPAGRALIPAAPLRLVSGAVGTTLADHAVADAAPVLNDPPQLVCLTALWAPRGLRDAIVHVWRKDQRVVDRIAVTVEGGREAGFRTYSIKRNLGEPRSGSWSCAVETASGQLLGSLTVRVTSDPRPPPSVPAATGAAGPPVGE